MSFQTFVCGGNLTADPEMKYVRETPKTSFSIAVNKRTRDGEKTLYIDVETWDKLAESVAEHKRKGDYVVVIGEWDMDEWDDQESGKKRRKWFVRGRDVRFEGPKSGGRDDRDDDRPRRSSRDDDRPRRSRDRDDDRPRRGRDDDEDRGARDKRYDDLPF